MPASVYSELDAWQFSPTIVLDYYMEHGIILNLWHILIRDEYKEFEKLIQEDLQEVDKRLEEEEVWTIILYQVSLFIEPLIEPCKRYTEYLFAIVSCSMMQLTS